MAALSTASLFTLRGALIIELYGVLVKEEVAKNLKRAGVSSEIISQSTGLTKKQIDKL